MIALSKRPIESSKGPKKEHILVPSLFALVKYPFMKQQN